MFAKNGFNKTKMIDIARETGIGKGTVYEYFSSKDEIFFATFQYLFQQMDQSFQQKLKETPHPVDRLKLIIQTYFVDFIRENGDFMCIVMDFWMAGARDLFKMSTEGFNLISMYEDYRKLISDILRQGIRQNLFRPVNTNHYASMLLALLDGLYLQIFLDADVFKLEEMADNMLDLFLKSLTNLNGA